MTNQKITFSLKGQDYHIGTVTIRQYYEIYQDIERDDLESHFQIASKLSKCPAELLRELPAQNWQILWASIVGMLNSYFLQDIQQITQEFTFGGIKYGLVNMNQMTIGEFADLDVITNSESLHSKYHEMLAILYRPIVKKNIFTKEIMPYAQINYEEQCEVFKDLPLQYVKSAISFFLRSANQSLANTVTYLETQMNTLNLSPRLADQLKDAVSVLQETGGDLLTPYQKNGHFSFVKLPSLELENPSTGLPGDKIKSPRKRKQSKELQEK